MGGEDEAYTVMTGESPARRSDATLAPAVSVVVPMRNERATLETLYEAVRTTLERHDVSFELVLVDDGSTDGSSASIRELMERDSRVRGFRLRRNFGKAAALATGLRAACGDVIVTMDADLQDDPAEVPRLLDKINDGFACVSGWKRRRHDPWSRRAASKVFNWATRILCGITLHDVNCGLKAYTRECALEVADGCYGELHRFLPVVAYWKGFSVTEIAVNHRKRSSGRSRYGIERYLRGLLDLLTTAFLSRYARRPMHVFGGLGIVLLLGGSGILAWMAFAKLALGQAIGHRPLLTLGTLLFLAGLQLVLAGLIAEMISRAPALVVKHQSGRSTEYPATALARAGNGRGPRPDLPIDALLATGAGDDRSIVSPRGDLTERRRKSTLA